MNIGGLQVSPYMGIRGYASAYPLGLGITASCRPLTSSSGTVSPASSCQGAPNPSPAHPLTRSPAHPLTRSPAHPLTRSPAHPP
ncbi:hypothetical protein B9Q04_14355, partial [Candidatus Marsarchaeota G2 archaeon BE_D]